MTPEEKRPKNHIEKIQKRDGRVVDFVQEKITNAIHKAIIAANQGNGQESKKISDRVLQLLNRRFKKGEIPAIEQVQDIVEETLILEDFVETAKAYILYRDQRRAIREASKVTDESSEKVDSYLKEVDWQVKENANMTYSLQGLNQYVGSYISKKYWLNKIYPKEIRDAASNEDFHIHNLELLAVYCAGWDLYDFLVKGFGGVSGKIQCRPPKHFRTALGQLVNVLFTLQGETAGANAVSNFDTLLAPFIRYDKLDYKQVKQSMQEFLYNCMVPTRVGFQSLTWDELVVVKEKGKVKFKEIGDLVDKEFEKNKHRIIEKNPKSYAVENHDDIYTLSFDENGKAVWGKIKAFVRHKVPKNSEFVRIKTNRGEAKVSKAHSLFSFKKFDNKFNVEAKSSEEVKIAKHYTHLNKDNHFIALKSFENFGNKEKLDLAEILDEIPQLHKNVFVKINPSHTLDGIRQNILTEKQSFIPFYKEFGLKDRGVWKDWLERKSMRYEVWRKYGNNQNYEFKLKNSEVWYPRILKGENLENFIKLCAWYIIEGHTAISTSLYVSQSPSDSAKEIMDILEKMNALGEVSKNKSYSKNKKIDRDVLKITSTGLLSEIISRTCGYLSFNKVIPPFIFELSPKYQKIFFQTLLKSDASEYKTHWDFATTSKKLSLSLSFLLSQNGYRFSVYSEENSKINKKWHDQWKIRIYKNNYKPKKEYFVDDFKASAVQRIDKFKYDKEYEYDISVDLPQENFIGGSGLLAFHNTPFLNVSLDIKPPEFLAKQPVIIGGLPQNETYGEFQPEIDMFIKAFYEGLMEGDASGRPFTFPIPTVSVGKDFDWDNPNLTAMWEATAKYGVNYFSNFIHSDMSPDDARSMCMSANEEVLIRNSKKIKRLSIKEIAENYKLEDYDGEGWAECRKDKGLEILSLNPKTLKTEWSSVKRFFRVFAKESVEIETEDGKKAIFSAKHPIPVYTDRGIGMKWSKDVVEGDYLISIKNAKSSLSGQYQKIEETTLEEKLGKLLGYFTADGNYLFENRKGFTHFGEPRGMQFTFKTGDTKNLELIKGLIKEVFNSDCKEKQDPRYNTYYLYFYNTEVSRKLYNAGFKKYGRLPQILFNSPLGVIKGFLEFHFIGDGYKKRGEIHINDLELSRDLVLLYSLVGQPVTYRQRKNSQVIYLQHSNSKIKKNNGWLNNPIISERVPGWMAYSTYKVPGLNKSRMVGFDVLEKYSAETSESSKIKNSDIYLVRVKSVKKETSKQKREFYDLELSKNHLFLHSLGQISFNCCRLRLDNRELYKRGGGLFGSSPKTGCYDDKTELLTENGWKLFRDLDIRERVYTLSNDNKIELHKPIKFFEYEHSGEMYQFKTKSLDLLVTPNHRMVVDSKYKNKRQFVEAKDFNPNSHLIPKQGIWDGEEQKYFILPSILILGGAGPESKFSEDELQSIRQLKKEGGTIYEIAEELNCSPVTVFNICTKEDYGNRERLRIRYETPTLKIEMDEWLKFFGFWIAEGCTDNENIAKDHGYRVFITQKNGAKKNKIKKVLDLLPFNYREEGENNIVICNKQLWTYLRQFGNKYQKFIPAEIKKLSRRHLKILFDWMVKGDGHVRKTNGQINYWTASKKLSDDLQEIIMKLGWLGTSIAKKRNISHIKGREIKAGIVYNIGVQRSKHYRMRVNRIKKAHYDGKVYCCEVKNNTVFVRRNGKVTWCGNSIGVVTINLPRIGHLSKTKTEFLSRLSRLMDLAKEGLEIKRKALDDFMEKGLYPYSRYYLEDVKKMRNSYFGNHFSTIGIMGMNESLLNFLGEDITTEKGRKFALEILDFMRERMIKFQEETGNLYNLEATPGEGTSYRQAKTDKEKYPDIITAGTPEVPYYTNSSQLPVGFTDDIFQALELQDELQIRYTGGTVCHLFLGERISDPLMAKNLVKKVFEKYRLPYITLTPTFSICPTHGYLSGEHFECPQCTIQQPCEVYSRVVGYIRPVQQWHKGKQEEYKERKEFVPPVEVNALEKTEQKAEV